MNDRKEPSPYASHGHSHGPGHWHDHDHDHDLAHAPRGLGKFFLAVVAIAAGAWLVYSVFVFVDQSEYVYVTEFGKPVRLHVEPGLKFKLPYQSVRRLDRRLQMANPPGSQMLTRDEPLGDPNSAAARQAGSLGGRPLSIEWFACWRIPTPEYANQMGKDFESTVLRFVQSVGSPAVAQDRLRERIDSMLKAKVGQKSLSQFVSLNPDDIQIESLSRELTEAMRREAIEQFGIEVVDIRIKRFNHPEGVKPSIFEMIRAERQGVAEKYRAEGKSEAAKIRSLADTERAQILSKAMADAERIRGEGEATAMRITNEAHGEDPQFYQMLKTLETYRAILNEKTTVVLSSDSSLLRLLTDGMPRMTAGPAAPATAKDGRTEAAQPSEPEGGP